MSAIRVNTWYDRKGELQRGITIDPEDREQVEQLVMACPDEWAFRQDEETVRECTDHMQAALRSLITPPKPPELTGLGAVVEDSDGVRWLLMPPSVGLTRWCSWDFDPNRADRKYADVTAIRILSEGVQP